MYCLQVDSEELECASCESLPKEPVILRIPEPPKVLINEPSTTCEIINEETGELKNIYQKADIGEENSQ